MRAAIQIITMAALFFLPSTSAHALEAQIGNFTDLALPTWSIGDPGVSAHLDLCVYATGLTSGTYAVTVSSLSAFNLSSGFAKIPYSIGWDDGGAGNLGGSSGASVTNAIPLNSRTGASTTSKSCSGGMTARLNLKITQAAMTAATGGTYSDVLTVLVSPN